MFMCVYDIVTQINLICISRNKCKSVYIHTIRYGLQRNVIFIGITCDHYWIIILKTKFNIIA